MKNQERYALAVLLALICSACATSGRSTLFGAGTGATIGAGIGALANPGAKAQGRIRNVFIGATAGSLLGAGIGNLAHEEIEDREKASFEKAKKESGGIAASSSGNPNAPVLLPPRVESRFVEEQVRGNVYVPAHYEYIIVEPARWTR